MKIDIRLRCLVSALLAALATPLSGRVGEKYEDFVKRVGPPEKSASTSSDGILTATHSNGSVKVIVNVIDGTIAEIAYHGVSGQEVGELLSRFPNSDRWEKSPESNGQFTRWRLRGTSIGGVYNIKEQLLSLGDGRYPAKIAEAMRDKQYPRLKGL